MFSSALWEQDGGQRPTLRAVGPSVRNRRQFAQLAKFVAYAFPETLTSLVSELQFLLLLTIPAPRDYATFQHIGIANHQQSGIFRDV